MAIRSTQLKRLNGIGMPFRGGATITGSQAHSNLMARRHGTEEQQKVSLPKLKFLEKPLDEDMEKLG